MPHQQCACGNRLHIKLLSHVRVFHILSIMHSMRQFVADSASAYGGFRELIIMLRTYRWERRYKQQLFLVRFRRCSERWMRRQARVAFCWSGVGQPLMLRCSEGPRVRIRGLLAELCKGGGGGLISDCSSLACSLAPLTAALGRGLRDSYGARKIRVAIIFLSSHKNSTERRSRFGCRWCCF